MNRAEGSLSSVGTIPVWNNVPAAVSCTVFMDGQFESNCIGMRDRDHFSLLLCVGTKGMHATLTKWLVPPIGNSEAQGILAVLRRVFVLGESYYC